MQWREMVAAWVCDEILAANQGRWPQNKTEWETLAFRFGDQIRYCDIAEAADANFTEGIFHVPTPGIKYPITHPLYIHELAEACLRWEGREPFTVPPDKFDDDRHQIALYVEQKSNSE